MIISKRSPYTELRFREYPEITEQLDAIYKMAEALQGQGIIFPEEVNNWINQCKAVKGRYSKK